MNPRHSNSRLTFVHVERVDTPHAARRTSAMRPYFDEMLSCGTVDYEISHCFWNLEHVRLAFMTHERVKADLSVNSCFLISARRFLMSFLYMNIVNDVHTNKKLVKSLHESGFKYHD